jgi:Flp pilus assembly protein CpaB
MTPEVLQIVLILAAALVSVAGVVWAAVSILSKPIDVEQMLEDLQPEPQTVYLIGRVRIPAGRATVWDVIGVVLTEDEAVDACTTTKDFYVPQHIGSLRDDKVVVPAVLTFPLRNKKSAEPKPEAE